MLKEWIVRKYYALESFFFLVAEKVVALVIAYDGEFKLNIVKKFYVLKVFFFQRVCMRKCVEWLVYKKKKKRLWEMILLFNGVRDGKLLVQKKYVQCTSCWTVLKATTW